MATPSSRTPTVAISLAGIPAILILLVLSGDFRKGNWGELIMATVFFSLPSLLLAELGRRPANHKWLSRILPGCAIVSSALWTLLAAYFATASAIDAQSGLLVIFVFAIQTVIVAIAYFSRFLTRHS